MLLNNLGSQHAVARQASVQVASCERVCGWHLCEHHALLLHTSAATEELPTNNALHVSESATRVQPTMHLQEVLAATTFGPLKRFLAHLPHLVLTES
jgi:hypothetical protein